MSGRASLVAWMVKICLQYRRLRFSPWVGKIPWRREWEPLHYSCLENSMDRGPWWTTVHGVAKSWTDTLATNTSTFHFHSFQEHVVGNRHSGQNNRCLLLSSFTTFELTTFTMGFRREFPGDPAFRTPHFNCRGRRFDP